MFKMSRQNPRRQVRLNKLMESRIPGDRYVRFGGEFLETYHVETWQGAGFLSYCYTTEKPEKNAVQIYLKKHGSFEKGLESFIADFTQSGRSLEAFVRKVNTGV